MSRLFATLSISLASAFSVWGQQTLTDSLLVSLKTSQDLRQKADLLNALASAYYDDDATKGYSYASKAYDLAEDIHYQRAIQYSLTLKGYYFFTVGDYKGALKLYRQSSMVNSSKGEFFGYNLVMAGNAFRALAGSYYNRAIEVLSKVHDSHRLAFAYKNLARLYTVQWKNKEAEEFLQKALKIYDDSDNIFGMADTWYLLSEVSRNQSDFREANSYIDKACAAADKAGDAFLKIQCLMNRGNIHAMQGEYTRALAVFFEALGILKTKDRPFLLAELYGDIGDVYRGLAQYDVACKYYGEALTIMERMGTQREIANLYANLALTYNSQHNFKKAHEALDKSLALRKAIKDEHGLSHSYNVLGTIYYQEKNYGDAIRALNQSLEIRKRINQRDGIASCLYNLSLIFTAQEQYSKALQFQFNALAIEESIGNKFNIGFSHNRLGHLYTKQRKFREAGKHLLSAQKIAQETRSKVLDMMNHFFWSSFYESRHNFAEALQHYKQYTADHDSINSDIGAQKLAELQAMYMMEKKDQEIALLNKEKVISQNEIVLQRSQIALQKFIILSGVIVILLISLLAFKTYQYSKGTRKAHMAISEQKEEIQSQSEELMKANATIAEINRKLEGKIERRTKALSQAYKELDTFFYRASHDFRRPLTTFMGLAEVAKVTVKDTNALELFDKVKETAFNLDKMLVKLQSISDMGSQQLVYKEVMIKEIFETVCDTFRDELHRKSISTNCEVNLQNPFISYPALIRIIIENLVENAIHFSSTESPFIRLKIKQNGDYTTIDMQDNGQGIDQEHQEHVFDMYFRANERSKGNGLGLYIVKKAVEKLKGSITVSSILNVGSTFTIMFPKS